MTQAAAEQNRNWVEVIEPHLPADAEAGLRQIGFVQQNGHWAKLVLRVADSRAAVCQLAERCLASSRGGEQEFAEILGALSDPARLAHPQVCSQAERLFWPAKITDGSLPTFIVSIHPDWAAHLFDERLAAQDLFGAEPQLALSVRNVYYRSAQPRVITAPARVLWYVTAEKGRSGTKSIRAVSYITDMFVGPASELFRQFRRLGVYKWRDVLATAKEDPQRPIMAFVFTHTELLPAPISWEATQSTLRAIENREHPLQGPARISNECFAELYRMGTTFR